MKRIAVLHEMIREVGEKDDGRWEALGLRILLETRHLRGYLPEPVALENERLTGRHIDIDEHDAVVLGVLPQSSDEQAGDVRLNLLQRFWRPALA